MGRKDVVEALVALIESAPSLRKGSLIELEARLQARDSSSLQNSFVERCISGFEEQCFEATGPWTESVDYFFDAELPRAVIEGRSTGMATPLQHATVRSTMQPDIESLNLSVTSMVKTRLATATIGSATQGMLQWKVAVSREAPVPAEMLPIIVPSTKHVRIKQRRSFIYTSERTGVVWRFDFTMSWSGTTKTKAETAQRAGAAPVYELEIELVHAHPDLTSLYIAESLLAKMQDFVDSPLETVVHYRTCTISRPAPPPQQQVGS